MFDCNNLLHPFQNDPGVSQRQRIMDDLLNGEAKIDGRTLADLLDYFVQLSRHIQFYDTDLSVSDWQPFFQKSLPFVLTGAIKFDRIYISEKVDSYAALFDKHPSKAGLQLLIHSLFFQVINRINTWHSQLQGSGLPTELVLLKLIKDKLREPLNEFICLHNVAVTFYCIKPINFEKISKNDAWGLTAARLNNSDCKPQEKTKRKRLIALYKKVQALFPIFLDTTRIIADTSRLCIEQSILPLKEEFRENHAPHLALLFAFLKLFQHLQGDLNSFTKKHLDFFYKEVLQLKAKEAIPDKVHLVFEIQKQLDSYLLKKGLLAKDGKDTNRAEILFALDDEIVVNKAQVADTRTLFLNNQNILEKTFVEGVYMAPDATKMDGLIKPFKGESCFPTLGARLSKYTNPEIGMAQPYPNARIGFILASPVLLLNEGERKVDITLACEWKQNLCRDVIAATPASRNCCEENGPDNPPEPMPVDNDYESPLAGFFYEKVRWALNATYYYINEELIVAAVKKGIGKTLEEKLRKILSESGRICYCEFETRIYELILTEDDWKAQIQASASAAELAIIDALVKPRKAFKLSFSGEKEWIVPSSTPPIEIATSPLAGNNKFVLEVHATLHADQPAVTFFDKEKLKEDFNTTLPLVKIALDDKIKLRFTKDELERFIEGGQTDNCCLLKDLTADNYEISLYHFFRDVIITDVAGGVKTRIDVAVCGLKNLIVQNDESVQNVNAPIYPFGTRPRVGASFYIGSKELFSKEWQEVYVNAEWKDKPGDFGVHYKHYIYKDTTFEDDSKEIVNSSFLTTGSILDKGQWIGDGQRRLFKFIPGEQGRAKPLPPGFPPVPAKAEVAASFCNHGPLPDYIDVYDYTNGEFTGLSDYERRKDLLAQLAPYNVASQYGFLRFTLEGVSFQHDIFPFVLTRQLMAYAGLLSLDVIQEMITKADQMKKIIVAMISDINDISTHIGHIQTDLGNLNADIATINSELNQMQGDLTQALGHLPGDPGSASAEINIAFIHFNNIRQALDSLASSNDIHDVSNEIQAEINLIIHNLSDDPSPFPIPFNPDNAQAYGLIRLSVELNAIIDFFVNNLQVDPELKDGLPIEPYTPVIKSLSLDYKATAQNTDIDLIHLYPYENTYKHEAITLSPALLPTYCDEGNLFIGLKDLVPGSNLNILFQLAEATGDSESEQEEVNWHYLDNNQWKALRSGFELLDDATNGLTASGIVKFALPENMSNENSILPKGLHWIKASIPKNSKGVCETVGMHTQAMRSTFTNETSNDKLRLAMPLAAGAVAKLNEADAHLKKITQPYDSFGGRVPEEEGHFYVRVSEQLRHKGRAIQKFDYERLALEAFPQLFKVKCINHSFALNAHQYKNDFPFAPGYVILAVIPDLNQLKAAQSYEPRMPVSVLENIAAYMKQHASPFVRFRAMNPRYEKINFCLKVKLLPGKDEHYYKEKLKQDLRELLAPWAVGKYDKLTFGQCVNRSDVIRLLEFGGYVDYILELSMEHAEDALNTGPSEESKEAIFVCPKTPRSILIAGEIDVCIPVQACEAWNTKDRCDNPVTPVADYCPEIIIG